jgi:hypothetical protein
VTVRRLAVTAAALGALALSGCSGESTSAQPEPAPSSASPSPSSTEPALAQEVMAEPPERPEDKKTPKGAEAFATYVVEVLHHSVQQRDFSLLDSLMSEEGSCGTCANVQESVKASERKGRLELMTEPVRIKGAQLLDKENWLVGVLYRLPAGAVVDRKGETVETFPAKKNQYIEMGLQWHGGKWTFYNFHFGEE